MHSIGFIGAGRMATALASGLVAAGKVEESSIRASDPSEEARKKFLARVPRAEVGNDNRGAANNEVVVLAVKPQFAAAALGSIRDALPETSLLISIAAGLSTTKIGGYLARPAARIVRVMPNTPCLVGYGASGYSLGERATAADGEVVADILSAVGKSHLVEENLLDAVTGLSGSGPAFVYSVVEALIDGGVQAGLPRPLARSLAEETVRGAAEMVVVTGEDPAALRDQVTSPGGTTIAGLEALQEGRLRDALVAAVMAATSRSIELGKE